jgi:hypothetical protein
MGCVEGTLGRTACSIADFWRHHTGMAVGLRLCYTILWFVSLAASLASLSGHRRRTVISQRESFLTPHPPLVSFHHLPHNFLADPRNTCFRGHLLIERTSVKPVSPKSPLPQLSSPPPFVCGYPLLCLDLSTMARKSKSVLSQSESNCRPHRASSPTIRLEPHTGLAADVLHPSKTDTLTPPPSPFLRIFDPTILSSDHRNSKLSPPSTRTTLSSVVSRSYIAPRRQHVLPLNEHHTRPNSVVNQRNGLQTSNKSPQSSTTLKGSPTTSSHPVFHNVNDLAAHHGIPTFLPPTPRTVTRRTSPLDEMTPSSENDAFSSLCSEYLTMLDSTSPEVSLDAASNPLHSSDEQAAQAILSILCPGQSDHVLPLTHQESLTDCGCPSGDSSATRSEFLTSPMESPFDDFLSTPGLRSDDFAADFTSPLIADGDDFGARFHDTPLFDDAGLFEPPSSSDKRATASLFPSVNLDSMYTISPATPALDASPLFAPPPPGLSSNLPTGTRKNLTPEALIPLDAPVQSRNYITPSATSRKEPPRKRSRTEALGDDDEEIEGMADLDPVAAKRLQNTLAARRSRKRKLEHLLEIEATLDREKQQKEQWRSRAMTLEALLLSHGIPVPPAVNY